MPCLTCDSAALWPEVQLDVYGSIPHKLDSEASDIDMSVSPVAGLDDAAVLNRVARAIECCQCPYLHITRVLHARIPVISIADTLADGLRLDLSIWNGLNSVHAILVAYVADSYCQLISCTLAQSSRATWS